jgi:hypothetical protein
VPSVVHVHLDADPRERDDLPVDDAGEEPIPVGRHLAAVVEIRPLVEVRTALLHDRVRVQPLVPGLQFADLHGRVSPDRTGRLTLSDISP